MRLNMHYSVNQGALEIVKEILDRRDELLCGVEEAKSGAMIIDAGIKCRGTSELGRLIAETCLGGLGAVRLTRMFVGELNLPAIIVSIMHPKIAVLGSQYSGWTIKVGKYNATGSGPARALAGMEQELFDTIGYHDISNKSVVVLESRKMPTEDVIEYIAGKCEISPSDLYCIMIPANSIAASVQKAARVVEMGLFKAYKIGFDPDLIRRGHGIAPIAPVAKSANRAISMAYDCILYGGRTFYHVRNDISDLQEVVGRIPSCTAKQYGLPFYEILSGLDFDFCRIDSLLLSPAEVTFNHIESGKVYHAGGLNPQILRQSLGV